MKKRNLKSLSLNKKSISNLQKSTTNGGTSGFTDHRPIIVTFNPSIIDAVGCMSEMGCTTGPDETMTCAHWSCACGGEE